MKIQDYTCPAENHINAVLSKWVKVKSEIQPHEIAG